MLGTVIPQLMRSLAWTTLLNMPYRGWHDVRRAHGYTGHHTHILMLSHVSWPLLIMFLLLYNLLKVQLLWYFLQTPSLDPPTSSWDHHPALCAHNTLCSPPPQHPPQHCTTIICVHHHLPHQTVGSLRVKAVFCLFFCSSPKHTARHIVTLSK